MSNEVRRMNGGVIVTDSTGQSERYDHVVMASHADQSLKMLADPSAGEQNLLGAFRYSRNLAVLAYRRKLHAEATCGVVKLELYRFPGCRKRWRLRDLLDEPPAEH